jgi:hypothetical protein
MHAEAETQELVAPAAEQLTSDQAKDLVLRRWLYWGVIPLAVAFVLTVIANRLAPDSELSAIKLEDVFNGFLAVAAGAFLVAFYVDGYFTNPVRLADRAGYEVEEEDIKNRTVELPAHPVIRAHVVKGVSILALLGGAMGLAAIGNMMTGGPLTYGMQLIVLGAEYQLYILSRLDAYNALIEGSRKPRVKRKQPPQPEQ